MKKLLEHEYSFNQFCENTFFGHVENLVNMGEETKDEGMWLKGEFEALERQIHDLK